MAYVARLQSTPGSRVWLDTVPLHYSGRNKDGMLDVPAARVKQRQYKDVHCVLFLQALYLLALRLGLCPWHGIPPSLTAMGISSKPLIETLES